jgi:hypothetical protein
MVVNLLNLIFGNLEGLNRFSLAGLQISTKILVWHFVLREAQVPNKSFPKQSKEQKPGKGRVVGTEIGEFQIGTG